MGSSGKITGYSCGDGIPTKRKLLAMEHIEYTE
jgi:O6-methylguanine-DNA--protein-cysteine methyltransferase